MDYPSTSTKISLFDNISRYLRIAESVEKSTLFIFAYFTISENISPIAVLIAVLLKNLCLYSEKQKNSLKIDFRGSFLSSFYF